MSYKYLRRGTQFLPSIPSAKKTLNTSNSSSSLSSVGKRSSQDDFYHEYKRVQTPRVRNIQANTYDFSLSMKIILIFLTIAITSLLVYVFWNLYNLYIEIINKIKSKKDDEDDK
jgi:hypothetical protein